jgi:eukaryotic translation initiation factor 2C
VGTCSASGPRGSFRCSNSGFPLLNLDIGFSAFLASGPALEVIAKILGRDRGGGVGPQFGPSGGYTGGPNRQDINELSPTEIGIIKNKLRGAKVSSGSRQLTHVGFF